MRHTGKKQEKKNMSYPIRSKKNSFKPFFKIIFEKHFFKSSGREFQSFGPFDFIDRIHAFVLANNMCIRYI